MPIRRIEFLTSAVAATAFPTKTAAAVPARPAAKTVSIQYLGTAGWVLREGSSTVLVDPYITRVNGPPPPGVAQYSEPGDTRPVLHWDDIAASDEQAVSQRIARADVILVTHAHYDHILDVPSIALRTNALVLGTESTQNIMRAYEVPESQLLTVRGGEDYEFPAFSVKVIPSLHSALDHKRYFSSQVAPPGLRAPLTLRQIHPEGGTLAFLVRFSRIDVLAFGSMNYIEREIDGLRPDVLIAGAGQSRREIYEYTSRLLHAKHEPQLVLPTHWDNFLAPYGASQAPAVAALQSFIAEVRSTAPDARVPVPAFFEEFSV